MIMQGGLKPSSGAGAEDEGGASADMQPLPTWQPVTMPTVMSLAEAVTTTDS